MILVLDCTPPPHDLLQSPQCPNSSQVQFPMVRQMFDEPTCMVYHNLLIFTLALNEKINLDNLRGQGIELQLRDWVFGPSQGCPPTVALTLMTRLLDCLPPPQLAEHWLQDPNASHSQSTKQNDHFRI